MLKSDENILSLAEILAKLGKNCPKTTWNRLDWVKSSKFDLKSVVRNRLDSTQLDWLRTLYTKQSKKREGFPVNELGKNDYPLPLWLWKLYIAAYYSEDDYGQHVLDYVAIVYDSRHFTTPTILYLTYDCFPRWVSWDHGFFHLVLWTHRVLSTLYKSENGICHHAVFQEIIVEPPISETQPHLQIFSIFSRVSMGEKCTHTLQLF